MIKFNLIKDIAPYKIFYDMYEMAESASQRNIEAACFSSCSDEKIPHSRFINIKYVNDNEIIFFSNYQSAKANDIRSNKNVALTFFWNSINVQIRIQGTISKLDEKRSDKHWKLRKNEKNILAMSSHQSLPIASYEKVKKNYEKFVNHDLSDRPNYWGGYVVFPNYFEIWQGHDSRINKREIFEFCNDSWNSFFLEP